MSGADHALLHDARGRVRIVRLEPLREGGWRAHEIAPDGSPHVLEAWEVLHPHEVATRRLSLAEARQALREWEQAFHLSQSYVVRPFSPLKAWNEKWG